MHVDLYSWITVDAAKCDSMHFSLMRSTQRRPTTTTEAEAPSRTGLEVGEVLLAAGPGKRFGYDFGVG